MKRNYKAEYIREKNRVDASHNVITYLQNQLKKERAKNKELLQKIKNLESEQ